MKPDRGALIEKGKAALVPLFRHGGSAGTGISYGWSADAQGYGIWDHEGGDWFPDQTFAKDVRDIDGPAFFAERLLLKVGLIEPRRNHSPEDRP